MPSLKINFAPFSTKWREKTYISNGIFLLGKIAPK